MEIVVLEVMYKVVFVLIFNGITIGYDTAPIFQVYQQFSSLNSPILDSLLLNATNSTFNTFACHIKFLYLATIFLLTFLPRFTMAFIIIFNFHKTFKSSMHVW